MGGQVGSLGLAFPHLLYNEVWDSGVGEMGATRIGSDPRVPRLRPPPGNGDAGWHRRRGRPWLASSAHLGTDLPRTGPAGNGAPPSIPLPSTAAAGPCPKARGEPVSGGRLVAAAGAARHDTGASSASPTVPGLRSWWEARGDLLAGGLGRGASGGGDGAAPALS